MPTLSPQTTPYYGGGQVLAPPDTLQTSGSPNAADIHHPLGTLAIDNAAATIYGLASKSGNTATWIVLGGGASAVATLTGDTGTATPSSGNIKLAGTTNEITTAASGHTVTFTIPATFVAPGSIASTSTLTGGTGITATTGNIVATAGNISATAGSVSAGTSVTAGTTLTATLGNITATNGNFVASASGTGISLPVVTASGAASGTVNCNGRVGSITFTGVSIAAGADLTLTMGNTSITGASTRLLFSMSGSTSSSAPSVKSVTPSANQFVWVITNGTGAATTTADITFDFIVLN
jgi:hypothetical protein